MLAVEIVLIVVGTICICASFFVAKKKGTKAEDELEQVHGADLWTEKDEEVIIKHIDDILEKRGVELVETTEDQMNRICNEKIMAIDEFSKPLMEKIHTNHEEVVFMYNMLGEKQKELKTMMQDDTNRRKVPPVEPVKVTPEQEKLADPVSISAPASKPAPAAPKPAAPKPAPITASVSVPEPKPVSAPIPTAPQGAATGADRVRERSHTIHAPHEKKDSTPEISTGTPIRPDEVLGTSQGNEVGPRRTVFTAQQYVKPKNNPIPEIPQQKTANLTISQVTPEAGMTPSYASSEPFVMNTEGQNMTGIERLKPAPVPPQATQMKAAKASAEQLKRPTREFVMSHMEETAGNGRGEAVEDRIRMLYKQGKSVVDISKELNIGQGEVKLMIAMYKKRS